MTRFTVSVGGKVVGTIHHYTWFEAQWAAVRRYGPDAKAE